MAAKRGLLEQGTPEEYQQQEWNTNMRRTAGYTWTDYKTNTQITKELRITPILDKLLEYKRKWIQHVNRMPRRLPRAMKHYSPTGRRNYGRPLKKLLDTWDRNGSTSGPTPWQIWWWWWYLTISLHTRQHISYLLHVVNQGAGKFSLTTYTNRFKAAVATHWYDEIKKLSAFCTNLYNICHIQSGKFNLIFWRNINIDKVFTLALRPRWDDNIKLVCKKSNVSTWTGTLILFTVLVQTMVNRLSTHVRTMCSIKAAEYLG